MVENCFKICNLFQNFHFQNDEKNDKKFQWISFDLGKRSSVRLIRNRWKNILLHMNNNNNNDDNNNNNNEENNEIINRFYTSLLNEILNFPPLLVRILF